MSVYICVRLSDTLTGNSQYVGLDLSGDLEAASPLSVVCPTQARHIGHTALMDVHHAVWKTHTQTYVQCCLQVYSLNNGVFVHMCRQRW